MVPDRGSREEAEREVRTSNFLGSSVKFVSEKLRRSRLAADVNHSLSSFDLVVAGRIAYHSRSTVPN